MRGTSNFHRKSLRQNSDIHSHTRNDLMLQDNRHLQPSQRIKHSAVGNRRCAGRMVRAVAATSLVEHRTSCVSIKQPAVKISRPGTRLHASF